jgi:hypothetical protein
MLNYEKTEIKKSLSGTNICIVGNPKVGKTMFAANLRFDDHSTYFLTTEKGQDFVSIYGSKVSDWPTFEKLVDALCNQKKDAKQKFSMVVIDVIDNLIAMCEAQVCVMNKVTKISDIPYGGGWTQSKKMFMNELQALNNSGMGIIFITHAKDKELVKDAFKWTAAVTTMPTSSEEKILGLCDFILYFHIDKNNKRMIRCKPTKYVVCAGDRSGLLPELVEVPDMKNVNYSTEFFTKYFNEQKGK